MNNIIEENVTTTTTKNGDIITITQNLGINENVIYIFLFLISLVLLFMIFGIIKDFIVGCCKMFSKFFINKNKNKEKDNLLKELSIKEEELRKEIEKKGVDVI